jgi:hypothetical protein
VDGATQIDDVNTMLANAAVTFKTKRDEARATEASFRADAEDPRRYVFHKHNLELAAKAAAEAEGWEALRVNALDGVLLHDLHAPGTPATRLAFWHQLFSACEKAGRLRLGPHTGGNTADHADGGLRPETTSDGQGPVGGGPGTPKGTPKIG